MQRLARMSDTAIALVTAVVSIAVVGGALIGLSGWSESAFPAVDASPSAEPSLAGSVGALDSSRPPSGSETSGSETSGALGAGVSTSTAPAVSSPAATDFTDDVVANLSLRFNVAFTKRLAEDAAAGLIERVPTSWTCTPRGQTSGGAVDPTPGVLDCFAVTADDGAGSVAGAAYVVHINWRGGVIDIERVGPEQR